MTKRTLEELRAEEKELSERFKEIVEEYGEAHVMHILRGLAFPHKIRFVQHVNENRELPGDSGITTVTVSPGPVEDAPHLLVGKKGNEWSEQAEDILIVFQIPYRFQTISTPPHPNPLNCPGADPDVRAIPTLLLDYDTQDENGDSHHIRVPIATGIDEVKQWVRATVRLREQERTNDA